jgi:hypothetical protein
MIIIIIIILLKKLGISITKTQGNAQLTPVLFVGREEHRLRVFENRVLRRIFGLKRDEVTGGWRKLHGLYSSPNIVRVIKARRMRWAGHVARMGR